MPMVRKRDSIYFQLFQLLVLAALVSGLFFLVTNWAGDSLLNWFYISSNYEEKKNGEYIGRLQEYVSQNQLSTEDTKELTEWVRRQRVVALQLYKNGILVYNSEYPEQDMEAEQIEAGIMNGQSIILCSFRTGKRKFLSMECILISTTIMR